MKYTKNNLRYLGEGKKKKETEMRKNAMSHTLAKRCGISYANVGFGTSTDSRH
jgi:hypothetical protein